MNSLKSVKLLKGVVEPATSGARIFCRSLHFGMAPAPTFWTRFLFIWKRYILPSTNSYLSSSLSNLKVKELLCRKQIFVYGINHLMSRAESGAGSGISGSGAVQKIVSLAVFDCRWWKSTRRISDVRTDWHDNPYI